MRFWQQVLAAAVLTVLPLLLRDLFGPAWKTIKETVKILRGR